MKLKIPQRKKNKKGNKAEEGVVFDMTGTVAPAINSSEEGPARRAKDKSTKERKSLKIGLKKHAENNVQTAQAEPVSFSLIDSDEEAFEVNVRNSEPIIRPIKEDRRKLAWIADLKPDIASAGIIMAMVCLILTASDSTFMTLFTIPGFIVYMLISTLGSRDEDRIKRIRLIIAAVIGALLIISLIILRKYIGNGLALIMDQLYDNAEAAQAYVYDRFHVGSTGESDPERCMWIATTWFSMLAGLVTSLPPSGVRRVIALAAAAFSMLTFAYYGLIPSWACIAAITVCLVFVLSRGSILSSLAVLVVIAIVFGLIILIDPGESYGISRADENFRDRFAFKSAFLENDTDPLDGLDGLDMDQSEENQDEEYEGEGFASEHRGLFILLILLFILAAAGIAIWIFMKHIRKRRDKYRAGIDSSDPKEAITAMFPYAVRWLQPAGIDASGKTFTSLIPVIRSDISVQYADRYTGMYELWKEAAYSDHQISEESRAQMKWFLNDTISMIKDRSDLKDRIAATVKYAL